MTHVLLPRQNEKDLEEIPNEVFSSLTFIFADSVLDALGILFEADYTTEGPADRTRERSHKKEAVRVEKDSLMPDAEQPSVSAPEA
jgi:hypothetical protein